MGPLPCVFHSFLSGLFRQVSQAVDNSSLQVHVAGKTRWTKEATESYLSWFRVDSHNRSEMGRGGMPPIGFIPDCNILPTFVPVNQGVA
jgi:hypothetical protein